MFPQIPDLSEFFAPSCSEKNQLYENLLRNVGGGINRKLFIINGIEYNRTIFQLEEK